MPDLTFWTQRCKHQTSQGSSCRAGVVYLELLAKHPKHRLPCFSTDKFLSPMAPCELCERYTESEAKEEQNKFNREIDQIENGISPCCNADMKTISVVRSKYMYCPNCGRMVVQTCS